MIEDHIYQVVGIIFASLLTWAFKMLWDRPEELVREAIRRLECHIDDTLDEHKEQTIKALLRIIHDD